MARVTATIAPVQRDSTRTLVTMAAVIAALYFGSEIFVPIALAILLSFVLAPGVRKLHALGLGRIFPVLLMAGFAFTIIFTLAGIMASQLRDVAADLPQYEDVMTKKIAALKGATNGGLLQSLEEMAGKLDKAINKTPPAQTSPEPSAQALVAHGSSEAAGTAAAPVAVQLQQPARSPIETIGAVLGPLVHPLATAGIVVIFVIFILMQREDLRNRLIRLFGAHDLQRTTEAINDGAKRLSRYLLTQSLLNATTGAVVGLAAFAIGVPHPVLWGILFACMRFIPYIGPILGGVLPALFAAAVDPGWSVALWMAGTVLVIELLVGQMLEPLLYGHNTGLSPVAVVVSATFWTALWGPVGLLLSTPLTVCLVVIGRHVEQLEFLDVLLGDRPPLSAPETFYQRMLANDPTEVSDQAQECLKTMSILDYYDSVLLPGLLLAQSDVTAERLSVERQIQIRDDTEEVIEDIDEAEREEAKPHAGWRSLLQSKGDKTPAEEEVQPDIARAWQDDGAILCIGARGPLDDCAALMMAQVLGHRGLGAHAERYSSLSKTEIDKLDISKTRLICLSCLDGTSSAYLRFALRRIRRHAPRAKVLIGAWWMQTEEKNQALFDLPGEKALNEPVAATILDAVRYCLAEASVLTHADLSTTDADDDQALPVAS